MNSKVLKNTGWIIAAKLTQSVIGMIIGMISARYLGPSNYGLIAYAASVIAFAVPVMQLGLNKTLVMEIIEKPEAEGTVLGTALFLNVISSIACIIGVFCFFKIANAGENITIIVGVLYSISLIFQTSEVFLCWFQAKLLSKYTSISSIIAYTVVAVYKVFLLVTGKPVTWFAVSNSIDYLVIAICLFLIYFSKGNQRLSVSMKLGREMFRRSKHYIVSVMMVTIFAQTDRIMLKLMMNQSETGYYSVAVTCAGVTGFVFVAIIDSMRPVILGAKKTSGDSFDSNIIKLYCVITYLSLLQCVVITAFAKPIILILYGKQYVSSIVPLQIVVWYTTFSYYGSVRNIWILAENKQKYLWIINLSGAVANVCLNLVLIPICGAVGAAVASLLTQIFTNVIIGFILRPIKDNNRLMLRGINPKPLLVFFKELKPLLKSKIKPNKE